MGDYRRNNEYDVIIAGLGPAGANAAYHLGCAGIRTLAIEKKILPRQKTCAGGIPSKVVDLLDFDFSIAVEQEITKAVVSYRHDKKVEVNRDYNLGYVVNRSIFDHLLALRAKKAGARILEGESVKKVSEQEGMIEVNTNRDTYRCRALIGADGARGNTARIPGLAAGQAAFIGLEVYVTYEYNFIRNHINKLGFYFGYLPAGYGWIFPRREDASVGIGIPIKHARQARNLLADFLESLGLPRNLTNKAKGHALPAYSPFSRKPYSRNILLAGDAASFIDPVTGEGIYYALLSGKEAAHAIIESFKTGKYAAFFYSEALKKHIIPELRAAWKVSVPLNTFQLRSFNFFASNELIREMHLDVILGRRSYMELLKQVPRSFLGRLISGRKKFGS
ncbi:MAG: NAD(P)/FAD-dependent oxidoreductase [Smithella sp.]